LILLSIYNIHFEERVKRKEFIESRFDRIYSLGEKEEPQQKKTLSKKGP